MYPIVQYLMFILLHLRLLHLRDVIFYPALRLSVTTQRYDPALRPSATTQRYDSAL